MTTNNPVAQPDGVVETKPLPCPFCGSDAELVEWAGAYAVICANAECRADIGNDYGLEEKHVIRLWNSRATSPDSIAEKAERLAELIQRRYLPDHRTADGSSATRAEIAAIITAEFTAGENNPLTVFINRVNFANP